jgi:hypothetical protein
MEYVNLGGRPPIYEPTEDNFNKVTELCESYFNTLDKNPPLVTGLTLHLGFESKSTLYEYAKKEGFSNPIKKALTKIEMFHETATAYGDKCVGNIFILKNFNWKDTQDLNHSGNVTNTPPSIIFLDTDNED